MIGKSVHLDYDLPLSTQLGPWLAVFACAGVLVSVALARSRA